MANSLISFVKTRVSGLSAVLVLQSSGFSHRRESSENRMNDELSTREFVRQPVSQSLGYVMSYPRSSNHWSRGKRNLVTTSSSCSFVNWVTGHHHGIRVTVRSWIWNSCCCESDFLKRHVACFKSWTPYPISMTLWTRNNTKGEFWLHRPLRTGTSLCGLSTHSRLFHMYT